MVSLAKLKEITDLRAVWPHEASDFTPWLAKEENLNLLADAVGLEITVDETESSVGDFNVDIYASETGTERKIIIENQLGDTDHDHLGKLITYASGKGAEVVIWVVKRAREEHKAAVEWLNNHTDEKIGFFLVEIKLYRIGDSEPAVKFEVVERPNDWTKEIKKQSGLAPAESFRIEYWTAFNDYAFGQSEYPKYFKRRKPGANHWMTLSLGSSICHLDLSVQLKRSAISVELYIDEDEKKTLYHKLFAQKAAIEAELDCEVDWRELPEKRASRVILEVEADVSDRAKWPEQFAWMTDMAIRFKKAFKKRL